MVVQSEDKCNRVKIIYFIKSMDTPFIHNGYIKKCNLRLDHKDRNLWDLFDYIYSIIDKKGLM